MAKTKKGHELAAREREEIQATATLTKKEEILERMETTTFRSPLYNDLFRRLHLILSDEARQKQLQRMRESRGA